MKFKKRLLAITLASAMVLSLAACGNSGGTDNSASTGGTAAPSAGGDAAKDDGAIDTSEFKNIVWYHLGNIPTNGQIEKVDAEWDKILKEKVNANLEIKFIEWTDYMTKYNLLLASGEAFDMINTGSDWLDMWPNAQRSAFMDLTEMLPKYAPQTWAEVKPENWEQCKYEGKIITIPEDQYTQWINHGFLYRGDWAKEAGFADMKINNWDGMEKYFDYIKANKPDVIPYDCNGSIWAENTQYWMNSYTDSVIVDGVSGGLFWAKDYENITDIYSPYMDKELLTQYAEMMQRWSDKGFWRTDVLNYTSGDEALTLEAGTNGAHQKHTQTYSTERVKMDKKQPGSELQFFDFAVQGGKNLIEMTITHGAQSVPASSKNAERSLMVYDLIRNDEQLYRLMNWGLEGTHWIDNGDGTRSQPEGYDSVLMDVGANFWGGRMDKFEDAMPSDTIWSEIQTVYAEFDKYAKPYPFAGFVFNKTPIESELSALSDVMVSNMPAIALGKSGDYNKAIDKFISELEKAGYEKVRAEIQSQLEAWKK